MTSKSSTRMYFGTSTEVEAMSDLTDFFVEGDRIYLTDTHEHKIFDGTDLVDYTAPSNTYTPPEEDEEEG